MRDARVGPINTMAPPIMFMVKEGGGGGEEKHGISNHMANKSDAGNETDAHSIKII